MSRFKKLVDKVLQERTPRDITPDELKLVLERCGFEYKGTTGSHFVYKHKKLPDNYSIPMKNPVKMRYIMLVRQALLKLKEVEDE